MAKEHSYWLDTGLCCNCGMTLGQFVNPPTCDEFRTLLKEPKTLESQAKLLRAQGLTYEAIGKVLGLAKGKIWIICNRKRHNMNAAESCARYDARGRVPLFKGTPNV